MTKLAMTLTKAHFALENYGPDHKLLEALIKDSEEEWMGILRERKSDIIGLPACPLICAVKRWTAALSMMAGFQRPLFTQVISWEKSILYQYIRNNAFVTAAKRKWSHLPVTEAALLVAISGEYTEGVRALLKVVIFPDPAYWVGGSMLLEAVLSRNVETVRALLDYGLNDHFVRGCDTTAAAQAAQLGELEMMREIGWSANDDLVLERGVRGGSADVVKAIVAARMEKFNLERISRLTEDESLRTLLSEANAALPEKLPTSNVSCWRRFFANPKQPSAVSKKQMDAGTA